MQSSRASGGIQCAKSKMTKSGLAAARMDLTWSWVRSKATKRYLTVGKGASVAVSAPGGRPS
ncbi:hypothetical protein LINPERHAP1_LOCUS19906, partial [Linum perenne]